MPSFNTRLYVLVSALLCSQVFFSPCANAEKFDLSTWQEIRFSGMTEIDATKSVIHITSEDSATAYYYEFPKPIKEPFSLTWRWRVNTLTDSNSDDKEHDDYAARVYVVFGNFWNKHALNYVAVESLMGKSSWVNPFSKKSLMIPRAVVVGSKWQQESALPWQDYIDLFGNVPSQVLGIAVMTDTDNTHGSIEAWYKDIEIIF